MKFPFFVSVLIFSGLAAFASIPKQSGSKPDSSQSTSELALELLSMPEGNRQQIAQKRSREIYPELISISKNDKQAMETRWRALTLAGSIGKEQGLQDLREALKAKEWFLRNAALVSMKAYHPAHAAEAARGLLKDKALVVRSAAVETLGVSLDSRSRDLLWEEFNAAYNFRKGQSLWIRQQILSQLAGKPESKEMPLFVKALKEKDGSLQSAAVAGLERITDQKLGPKTASLIQKKELWLQWAKAQNRNMNL